MDNKNIKEIIKAILFVSGEGVSIDDIKDKLEISDKDINKYIDELKAELSGDCGIQLIKYKNKIQLSSNPEYADEISNVLNPIRERALTKAALETLAIIAYKQPVTRLDIEEIRGVGCDYTVQLLLDHNMIEVVGRKDVVGRPVLFGTTDTFLKRFSLNSLEDLPDHEELMERIKVIYVQQESDSLYRDFKLPDEEEIPDFLLNEENLEKIEVDEDLKKVEEME